MGTAVVSTLAMAPSLRPARSLVGTIAGSLAPAMVPTSTRASGSGYAIAVAVAVAGRSR